MTKSPTEHEAGLSIGSRGCLPTFILGERCQATYSPFEEPKGLWESTGEDLCGGRLHRSSGLTGIISILLPVGFRRRRRVCLGQEAGKSLEVKAGWGWGICVRNELC